jgi:alpha-beta hydrolase superfamily lysophospholipase
MSHVESGPQVLRAAMLSCGGRDALIEAAVDPARHAARARDLDAALSHATRNCRPRRLVLMGHSMGAMTTMAEAGATHRTAPRGSDRFDV